MILKGCVQFGETVVLLRRHQLDVLVVRQAQTDEDLEGGGRDAALVRARC